MTERKKEKKSLISLSSQETIANRSEGDDDKHMLDCNNDYTNKRGKSFQSWRVPLRSRGRRSTVLPVTQSGPTTLSVYRYVCVCDVGIAKHQNRRMRYTSVC